MTEQDSGQAAEEFRDPLVSQIVEFIRRIGLSVRAEPLPADTVLPGIGIARGVLLVDEAQLKYPGDLLHEAAHLAVSPPERRATLDENAGEDGGEELMSLDWSYAAALELKIDPAIVFHDGGYRGQGEWLRDHYALGRNLAVPMLQWCGMAHDKVQARANNAAPFPHMIRWVRERSGL